MSPMFNDLWNLDLGFITILELTHLQTEVQFQSLHPPLIHLFVRLEGLSQ